MKARAAVFEGPRKIALREFPIPEIGGDDMLMDIDIAGIDGTEVHMYLGDQEAFNSLAPCIIGDELIGTVRLIGERAAARRGLQVGDQVTVEAHWPCHDCPACESGQYYLCDKGTLNNALGWIGCAEKPSLWGAFATHLFVPARALVYRVPNDMPLDSAISCVSVLANGIRWVERCRPRIGDTFVILGPGPQGLMSALAAKESGAGKVVVVGLSRDAARLDMAKTMGADEVLAFDDGDVPRKLKGLNGGRLADAVIDTTGVVSAAELSVKLIRPGGIVNHVGLLGEQKVPLKLQDMLFEEKTLTASFSHPYTVQRAIDLGYRLWKAGKYDLDRMVTHRFGLDDTELALKTAGNMIDGERPIKTVLYPNR